MIDTTTIQIAFISVAGIQIIYWLVWLIGLLKIKKSSFINKGHGVSVVIAANNELDNLKILIPAILNQAYDLFEIIIIDDRSSDGTYEFLLEISNQHTNIKVLTVNELPDHLNGKKYAITLGIKSATYDQILLTDADCKPLSENWIGSFASAWNKPACQTGGNTSFVLGFSSYARNPGLLNLFHQDSKPSSLVFNT